MRTARCEKLENSSSCLQLGLLWPNHPKCHALKSTRAPIPADGNGNAGKDRLASQREASYHIETRGMHVRLFRLMKKDWQFFFRLRRFQQRFDVFNQ